MTVLDVSDVPNMTEEQLFHYMRHELGISGVTRHLVKKAVMTRQIVPTRIGKANMFSRADAMEWLAAQKSKRKAAPHEKTEALMSTPFGRRQRALELIAEMDSAAKKEASAKRAKAAAELAEIDSALAELS